MSKEIIQELLKKNPELLQDISFNTNRILKTPENFEEKYEQALEYLKSGTKADLLNYRNAVSDLIKEGGLVPILIYNSGKYKGFENLDTPEERKNFYDNWDKMVDEYNLVRNDPATYTKKKIKFGQQESSYGQWKISAGKGLEGLSQEQKESLFAANLFMSEHTRTVANNPAFYKGISDPTQKNKGAADCNTMASLYAGLLIQAQDKNGNDLFPSDKLNFKFYMDAKNLPVHVGIVFGNTNIETTNHSISLPEPYKKYKSKIADNNSMVAVMMIDQEVGGKITEGGFPYDCITAGRISIAFNDDKITLPLTYHINACAKTAEYYLGEALKLPFNSEEQEQFKFSAFKVAMESGYKPTIASIEKNIIFYFLDVAPLKARYEADVIEQAQKEAEKLKTPGKQRN